MQVLVAAVTHLACYGILVNKTPDGSRAISDYTNAAAVLNKDGGGRKSRGPGYLSHHPNMVNNLFCAFDHGPPGFTYGTETRSDRFNAQTDLAQLYAMGKDCAFCLSGQWALIASWISGNLGWSSGDT